jgi:DeoR family fructose operon transcriptional repressor
MYTIERRSEILRILEQSGKVDVNELAKTFLASKETIRRDLHDMESDGVLKRTHGGAVINGSRQSMEFPVNIREIRHYAEKDAICRTAAQLIKPGDCIFIDNSSTCINLFKYIPNDIPVTILTNSIKVLLVSAQRDLSNHPVICLGGTFNPKNLSLYGSPAQKQAAEYYPDKAFMSCAGIFPPDNLTDSSMLEVETKRLMIERSRETIVLADHSKFKQNGTVTLGKLSAISVIVTDLKTDPIDMEFIKKAGKQILRSNPISTTGWQP